MHLPIMEFARHRQYSMRNVQPKLQGSKSYCADHTAKVFSKQFLPIGF